MEAEVKLEVGRDYMRNGIKCRLLYIQPDAPKGDSFLLFGWYNAYGHLSGSTDWAMADELVLLPCTVVRYVNLDVDDFTVSYATRAEADEFSHSDRVACIRVELEVGRFDA